MPISRYVRTPVMDLNSRFGTSRTIEVIRTGIANGSISFDERTLQGAERLDVIAGQVYGESQYWWIIAAASDIGWAPQAAPGTYLRIPLLEDVFGVAG